MGPLYSDLEDLYRRRHRAFQMMLASVTGSVESARDVVQEAFAKGDLYAIVATRSKSGLSWAVYGLEPEK